MSGSHRNELGNVEGRGTAFQAARDINLRLEPPQPPPAPRQLPQADRKYTNRSRELVTLDDLAEQARTSGRGVRALLTGPEGMGKSALLAEFAQRRHATFEHGVLHVELWRYRDREGNADYEAALDEALRSLHVRDNERVVGLGAKRARFSEVTSGLRLLVTLDDAAESREIDLFRPGNGPYAMVVACRADFPDLARLISGDAEVLRLDRLADPDGLALLSRFPEVQRRIEVVGEAEAARRLVSLCGGLPPAIRMAAAHLTARPELTINGLVEAVEARYQDAPGTSPVNAVITLALGALTEDRRELLRRLSEHPGRFFPAELGTAMMGDSAGALLRDLADASVLRTAGEAGYTIVELVRGEVRTRDPAPSRERRVADGEAILRFFTVSHTLVDLYTFGERLRLADTIGASEHTVAPADYYQQPFATPAEAADWQDRHIGHTPGLMRLAVDLGHPEAALLLADTTWLTYHGRGRLAEGTSAYGYAVAVARSCGHHAGLARTLTYLARLNIELREWERAREQLAEAETAAESSGDSLNHAVVLEGFGLLHQRMAGSDHPTALRLLGEARAIHRDRRRPRGDAMQTYQLGGLHREMGELDRSLAELTDAEDIATRRIDELSGRRELGHETYFVHDWTLLRARIRLALARTRLELSEEETAERAANAAREVFADERDPVREARALRVLGTLAERRGDERQRSALLRRAHRLYTHYHLHDEAGEITAQIERESG